MLFSLIMLILVVGIVWGVYKRIKTGDEGYLCPAVVGGFCLFLMVSLVITNRLKWNAKVGAYAQIQQELTIAKRKDNNIELYAIQIKLMAFNKDIQEAKYYAGLPFCSTFYPDSIRKFKIIK